jgi:glutathione synthase/RimK-type ligase-like ATP-grasp enzyme
VVYAIGDVCADTEQQFDLFSTFENVVQLTYEDLMSAEKIIARNADIVMFFPYNLWDILVETGNDIYGVGDYGKKIDRLKIFLCEKLEQVFPEANYVNKPHVFALERDKIDTKTLLDLKYINVAAAVAKDMPTIRNALEAGNCIYVKVRYGSMGKGITRLEEGKWLTNFRFENGEIKNHQYDDQWKTIDVTDNYSFLGKLLQEDVLVEEGVETPKELGHKFDIRGIFIYGKLAELYGRASENPMITNLSQGGDSIEFNALIDMLGHDKLANAVREMHNANRVFGTNLLGVDVTFDENLKPYIIEVNSFPGLGHGMDEEHIREGLLRDVYTEMINGHKGKNRILGKAGDALSFGKFNSLQGLQFPPAI